MSRARTPLLAAAALAAAAAVVPAAHAAQTLPTPSSADVAAATRVAATEGLGLATRAAEEVAGREQGLRAAADDPAAVVPGTTTVVRTLAPRFVADGTGPVADVTYVSNSVRAKGVTVSVWSARVGGRWQAVNAASGDVEARMAAAAHGDPVFVEPQVDAWYALDGDRVRPLDDDARAVVGDGVTLAAYQRIVHDRYADMLPGSAYAREGRAGGFGVTPRAAAAPATPAPTQGGSAALPWALAGAGVAAGAAALVLRTRRRA